MTAATDAYPKLFSPLRLGPVTLPNRVVFAPTFSMWTDSPFTGVITEMGRDYWVERARGGVGLVTLGAHTVDPTGSATVAAFPQLYDERNVPALAGVVDAIHAEGAKVGVQLFHGGVRNPPIFAGHPAADIATSWHSSAPSEIPLGEFPGSGTAKELDGDEIKRLIADFGSAAARAMDAGADGVELHLAHGYLPHQFLSPFYNKREDEWGGSLEKRLRFPVEVLRSIRESVGDRGYVGYRISADTFWDGDMGLEDTVAAVRLLHELIDVDYASVTVGVHHSWIHSPMWFDGGWERDHARAIKDAVDVPTMMVGRITTPDTAEELLESGAADAICLARQLFSDPEWANKAKAGHPADIRPCVGANQCWRGVALTLQCVHNPTIGREARWGAASWDTVKDAKRVLILGGGPAGLEYARVAAKRGHEVVLVDRGPEPGGHVRAEAKLPKRATYGQMVTWLSEQAGKHGADLRVGQDVDAGTVASILAEERPDHIVLATGSTWRRDGFQGFTGQSVPGWKDARCLVYTEALAADDLEGPVMVLDDSAGVIAPLTAVALSEHAPVTLVTRWPTVGMDTMPTMYFPWIVRDLYLAGVKVICDHFVRRLHADRAELYNIYDPERGCELEAGTVVMVTTRTSDRLLESAIKTSGTPVEVIGDALSPRTPFEAIFEAHRGARSI